MENLVYLNSWNVICDKNGSSYSYLNKITESVRILEKETKKYILGLKMCLRKSNDSSYCRMNIQQGKAYNFTKTQGLQIKYKSTSPIRVYIKQLGQSDSDPMFYQDIIPQENWTSVILKKEDFISPPKSSIKRLDWKKVIGFQIEPQTNNNIEHKILISEFTIMNYKFIFYRILPFCIKYKSVLTKVQHQLKFILDAILFYTHKPFDKGLKKHNIYYYGSNIQKKKLWDEEYNRGEWDYLLNYEGTDNSKNEETYSLIEKYITNANILDLGCGLGSLIRIITDFQYQKYLGLDISSCAINKAREIYSDNKSLKFEAAEIFTFIPDEKYDLIFMSEILYYFSHDDVKQLIEKYFKELTEKGVICVRIWSVEFYKYLVDMLITEFEVSDYIHFDSPYGEYITKGVMLFLKPENQ